MEQSYPKFTLPNAEENLLRICKERIRLLYGINPPELVTNRFEAELAMMQGTNHSSVYMLVHHLTEHLRQKGYRTGMRGTFGSTFICFLLGITEENPLPAHYRCPNCEHTQWMPEAASGYDLPTEICSHCGRVMYGDGHNLPYETGTGLAPGEQEPYVEMHLTPAARESAVRYLVQLLGEDRIARACEWNNPVCFMLLPEGMDFEDVTPVTMLDPPVYGVRKQTVLPGYELRRVLQKVLLLPLDTYGCISEMHHLTNTRAEDICYNDPNVYRLFKKLDILGIPEFSSGVGKEILGRLENVQFSDLVRISGMIHGTDVWYDNGERLLEEHPFHELIGDRNDIFLTLQKYGVDWETAYMVTETVRKGKFGFCSEDNVRLEKKLYSAGVPQWYIDSMKRITYLFCKSHLIVFVKLYYSLAWFKCYYPEQFYNVTLRNLGAKEFLHDSIEDLKEIIEVYVNDEDDPPEEIVLLLEACRRNIPIAF
jgi:DNA polymerase-3 subunit alpha (Gram-positive type)